MLQSAPLLSQVPTVCDVYDTTAFYNEMNTAVLDDGCIVQVISAGPDSLIATPIQSIGTPENGSPTGDDELLRTFKVGENMPPGAGRLFSNLAIHSDSSARPYPGELLYARIFNRSSLQNATYYGDSPIYTCEGVNGEAFIISLPPENRTNRCLEPYVQVALPETLGVDNFQITIPIRLLKYPAGLSLWKYHCRIVFADSVLDNPVVSDSGILTDEWETLVYEDLGDTIYVYAEGTSPLAEMGTIVNINFDVVGQPGDSTGLVFQFFTFNQGEPQGDTQDGGFKIVPKAEVAGTVIYWATEAGVADTRLAINSSQVDTIITDNDGVYSRCCLPLGLQYIFTPFKISGFDDNSIIAYDASLAAQIALGLFESTESQNIAADVDVRGSVNAYDAACIARFAIGLSPLPNSKAGTWMFDPDSMRYVPLENDQAEQNYTAYLLGDVDGNWTPEGEYLVKSDLLVRYDKEQDLWAETGKRCVLPFYAPAGMDVLSCDLDLNYPPQMLKFIGVEKTGLSKNFQALTNSAESGRLRVAAYGTQAVCGE